MDQQSTLTSEFKKDPKSFFLATNQSLKAHYTLQASVDEYPTYCCTFFLLTRAGVELSIGVKARLLASAFVRNDRQLVAAALEQKGEFGIPEVLKALLLLDGNRKSRQILSKLESLKENQRKRLARLADKADVSFAGEVLDSNIIEQALNRAKAEGDSDDKPRSSLAKACRKAKIYAKKISGIQHQYSQLTQEDMPCGVSCSVSGATAKHIRRWIRTFSEEELQKFTVMQMPRKPWQELADVVHPSKLDFALSWFLDWIFGAAPPAGSLASVVEMLDSADKVEGVVDEGFQVPYSVLRRKFPSYKFSNWLLTKVSEYTSVDQILWYIDDGLNHPGPISVLRKRLAAGEKPTLPFGKLVERILTMGKMKQGSGDELANILEQLKDEANQMLAEIDKPLDPPVLVVGDASASMQVCIETASIIGSMVSALTSSDLVFFNREARKEQNPEDVQQVLDLASNVRARNCTAVASGLKEAYEKKIRYKSIVMVTDEEENTPCNIQLPCDGQDGNRQKTSAAYKAGGRGGRQRKGTTSDRQGYMFTPLLKRYIDEVSPDVKVVFISFLRSPACPGQLVSQLKGQGVADPLQIKFSQHRPDLTKLGNIFAQMALQSISFEQQLNSTVEQQKRSTLIDTLRSLNMSNLTNEQFNHVKDQMTDVIGEPQQLSINLGSKPEEMLLDPSSDATTGNGGIPQAIESYDADDQVVVLCSGAQDESKVGQKRIYGEYSVEEEQNQSEDTMVKDNETMDISDPQEQQSDAWVVIQKQEGENIIQ